MKKSERRAALVGHLLENPFSTDDELADRFQVSVATIRLDRVALHIPEVRERTRMVAAARQDMARSLPEREIAGRLVELHLGHSGRSIMEVTAPLVFSRTGIARGHYLFAQINSLATAVVNADVALTAKTSLRFAHPARLGDLVHARVDVVGERASTCKCQVVSSVNDQPVLEGVIWVVKCPLAMVETVREEATT